MKHLNRQHLADPVRSGRPRRPDRLGARRAAGLRVCSGGQGVVGASSHAVGRPRSRRRLDERQQLLHSARAPGGLRQQGVPRRQGPRRRTGPRAKRIEGVRVGGEVGSGPPHWYENLAAKSRRSSLIIDPPDGRLPALTDEAKQRFAAADAVRKSRGPSDSWEDRSLWDRCITVGLPAVMVPTGYNNNVQILQTPGYVTVTHEMMHDTRIIPLDGRRTSRRRFAATTVTHARTGKGRPWSSTSPTSTRR